MADWRKDLGSFFEQQTKKQEQKERTETERFISDVVVPAMESLREELIKHGRTVSLRSSQSSAQMIVQRDGSDEFTYRVQSRTFPERTVPFAEVVAKERKGVRLIRTESMFRSDSTYTIKDIDRDEVIRHFLQNYTSRVGRDD